MDAIKFKRCRDARPANKFFAIDTAVEPDCSARQVIKVESARLVYSARYNPGSNPPRCPWWNCSKPTDVPARLCDGRTYCHIRQTILNRPGGTALCGLSRNGNFIRIEFTCVTRMISLSFPECLRHFFKYFTLNIVTLSDDRWTKLQQSVISKVLRTYRKHS